MTPRCLIYEVQRPPRWDTFLFGLAVNTIALLALIVFHPQFTNVEVWDVVSRSSHVSLVAPALENHQSIPAPPQVAKLQMREPPKAIAALPKLATPKVKPHKVEETKIEPAKSELPKLVATAQVALRPKPASPKQVQTNVFTSAPSDTATVQKPARQVQTGGFGDPSGIAGQGIPKRNAATVAHLGSFDLPAGPGQGNGTARSDGATGLVRNAGFGNRVSASNQPRQGRTVADSGFREAVSHEETTPTLQRVKAKPLLQPVEILYKPRPAYTAQARRRRLEGEVLLEVVFQASGALRINRVVKGLGFGLDETALTAAQHIQFRPARRDGQPYDYAALVHIVFELSE